MENNQKINCTVCSCEYNDQNSKRCELHQINVEACKQCSNGLPEDESMCGSYRARN